MPTTTEIEHKLRESLAPSHLEVLDESAAHKGHAGARPGGGSHFRVIIRSDAFKNLNKVQQHQAVYKVLQAELHGNNGAIHALALDTGA